MTTPEIALQTDRAVLFLGDSSRLLDVLEPNSVDAIVTDPPSGIGFMGEEWDSDKGGREQWIAWLAEIMRAALVVLKPGGHALVWALPRTSHWTATALEVAGFEIRDRVSHLFGTGFPKSLNVVKAGAGEEWEGWGTALKPACEDWWLVRKPLEGTYIENLAQHGGGALNIDGCRIGSTDGYAENRVTQGGKAGGGFDIGSSDGTRHDTFEPSTLGRWPAHVVLSHDPRCYRCDGGGCGYPCSRCEAEYGGACDVPDCDGRRQCVCKDPGLDCVSDCPVRLLDAQAPDAGAAAPVRGSEPSAAVESGAITNPRKRVPGKFHADKGGASRFFYVAKPGTKERDAGCEALPLKSGGELTDREDGSAGLKSPRAGAGRGGKRRNHHPTVKSIDLMRWLCRLVTPPGGLVLDPFAGSGSTGVAALAEGFEFVGFEGKPEFVKIAEARLAHAAGSAPTTEEKAA